MIRGRVGRPKMLMSTALTRGASHAPRVVPTASYPTPYSNYFNYLQMGEYFPLPPSCKDTHGCNAVTSAGEGWVGGRTKAVAATSPSSPLGGFGFRRVFGDAAIS